MVNLIALLYVAITLAALWWFRKETRRLATEVVTEETRWMNDEFDRLARRIDKLTDRAPSATISARHRKLLKDL